MPSRSNEREGRAVHQREILVGEVIDRSPTRLRVRTRCLLHRRDPAPESLPEAFRRTWAEGRTSGGSAPAVDQHVIASGQGTRPSPAVASRWHFAGRRGSRRHTKRSCLDDDAQDHGAAALCRPPLPPRSSAASAPRYRCRATCRDRRSTERSAPRRRRSARSRSTKAAHVSASEMPCAAARARASACRSGSSDIWVRTIIVALCHHLAARDYALAPTPSIAPERGARRLALRGRRLWRSIGAHHGGGRFGCLSCTS